MVDVTGGEQPDDGGDLRVADPGAQKGGQRGRQGVGERLVDLVADAGGDGELQVPALVRTAGPAAQGEGVGGEAEAGGVVVDGVELGQAVVNRPVDPGRPGQVGQPGVVGGFVLPLDLALGVRHIRTPTRVRRVQADIGRCTLMDCNSPIATQTANIEDPP